MWQAVQGRSGLCSATTTCGKAFGFHGLAAWHRGHRSPYGIQRRLSTSALNEGNARRLGYYLALRDEQGKKEKEKCVRGKRDSKRPDEAALRPDSGTHCVKCITNGYGTCRFSIPYLPCDDFIHNLQL